MDEELEASQDTLDDWMRLADKLERLFDLMDQLQKEQTTDEC